MKRTITTLALAASMMLLAIPAALATHVDDTKDHGFDESQDKAGALRGDETGECRPGANDNDNVGSWELEEQEPFTSAAKDRARARHADGDYVGTRWEEDLDGLLAAIDASLDATWTFCDKNRDGFLCVMTFNDVSPYGYTLLDNRPFRSK